jgi:hypothetical protein
MPVHLLPENLAYLLTALAIAFLIALWVGLIYWAFRDIRNRTHDRMAAILAVFVVVLFNIPGLLLYVLLRPARTMEEEYQASLEEESLLASIASRITCPGCGRTVESDWIVCPTCSTRLRKPCPSCQYTLELSWAICPRCATPSREAGLPPLK